MHPIIMNSFDKSLKLSLSCIINIHEVCIINTELNDKRKTEVSVERISVCNVIKNLAEHGIRCLPCSDTTNVIAMLLNKYDVILMSK